MTLSLGPIDIAIIALYMAIVVTLGVIMKRRAERSLGSYFLGERELPWWALAMSGSSSYFDITGTMWIVGLFFTIGLRGMWVQWIWGFPITVFYMAYMGAWIRRSKVMTGSEWMETRFGTGKPGEWARLAYTI
jgi:Na+/proline symporter